MGFLLRSDIYGPQDGPEPTTTTPGQQSGGSPCKGGAAYGMRDDIYGDESTDNISGITSICDTQGVNTSPMSFSADFTMTKKSDELGGLTTTSIEKKTP